MRGGFMAAALALLAAGAACGGDGVDAPRSEDRDRCPPVDAWLDGFYRLLDEGRLDHLRAVLADDLDLDARRDLVATLIDLVDALGPGTFAGLGELGPGLEDPDDLQGQLAGAVRFLAADGPGAPYPEAVASLRAVLGTCDGPPVFQLLLDVLADEPLLRALLALPGALDLPALLGDVTLDGARGRPAVHVLARNLLVAATSPDFTVDAWIDLLGLVVDLDAPPLADAVAGLERLLAPGPSRAALQGLAACLLAVDPDLPLADALYDLLTEGPLDLAGLLGALPDGAGEGPLLPPALARPLTGALAFLRDDARARRSLVAVLAAALAPPAAPGVLADVADLLEARIVGDVVEVLSLLARRGCAP